MSERARVRNAELMLAWSEPVVDYAETIKFPLRPALWERIYQPGGLIRRRRVPSIVTVDGTTLVPAGPT